MNCRLCQSKLEEEFIDLGKSPLANGYLGSLEAVESEKWYPLRVLVCTDCWLVQTEEFIGADEVFASDYAYFSSFSDFSVNLSNLSISVLVLYCKLKIRLFFLSRGTSTF